eukprot:SAG31_NODE_1491_length_8133_cov_8.084267_1_plen_123_part_10
MVFSTREMTAFKDAALASHRNPAALHMVDDLLMIGDDHQILNPLAEDLSDAFMAYDIEADSQGTIARTRRGARKQQWHDDGSFLHMVTEPSTKLQKGCFVATLLIVAVLAVLYASPPLHFYEP